MTDHRTRRLRLLRLTNALAALLVVCALALPTVALAAQGAPDLLQEPAATPAAPANVRATRVSGALTNQYSAHYLGLSPLIPDRNVTLTLAFDPQDPLLRGKVNFLVITEDGLRRFLAGEEPDQLDIAAGAPVAYTGAQNLMEATFLDSGRGNYTVIVYNESTTPITYSLVAQNAALLDTSSQVGADAADILPEPTPTPSPYVSYGPVTVTGRRLSGELDGTIDQHYLAVAPEVVDGLIQLRMQYAPLDQPELAERMNFYVLDADGIKRVLAGATPGEVQLATGFPSPFGQLGELHAAFQAAGSNEYTAVLYNRSGIPGSYALNADGALLVDRYGQTNESVAAAAEQAALAAAVLPTVTPAPSSINVGDAEISAGLPDRLQGQLPTAYSQHYLGLLPNITNGTVTVVLDFDPKDSEALRKNINFWVLDSDDLRRVVAGARPNEYHVAAGSPIASGPDEGKLRADFNASGRNEYTLIIYNNSEVSASYRVQVFGAGLADTIGQTTAVTP